MRGVFIAIVSAFCAVQLVTAQNCYTPNNVGGSCINIKQCQPLLQLVQKRPLSPQDNEYLRQSQCGFEGATPKVCCPPSTGPPPPPSSCNTPNNQRGTCIVIDQCPSLVSILNQRPMTNENRDFLRRSQCGVQGTRPRVCCSATGTGGTGGTGGATKPPVTTPFQFENFNIDTGNGPTPSSPLLPPLNECGTQGLGDRILNGEPCDLDEFPWMVLLEYSGGSLGCGGVLISHRYVMTAAHCVKGEVLKVLGSLVSVRLGEYDILNDTDCVVRQGFEDCSDPPLNIEVEEAIAHPNWKEGDRNHYHDIALVRLKQDVQYTDFVKPICLPNSNRPNAVGETVFVAGWGKTETGHASSVKLKLQVPVVSLEQCSIPYSDKKYQVKLFEGQFCAGGEEGKDSCRGDSGGPLMRVDLTGPTSNVWFCTGVVSFGPSPCGQRGFPGIYTSVSKYVKWMLSNMRQ